MPKASATQKQDMRYLERVAKEQRPAIPPAAHLNMTELFEVERLANIGANLHQIGIHLRKPADIWDLVIKHNPNVSIAYESGFNRFQLETMQKIKDGILAGDTSLIRLAADRMLGQQWAPPKQAPAILITPAPAVQIDVDSVRERLQQQRQLQIEAGADSEDEAGADSTD